MNENVAIDLGKKIRTLRKLKGLTQEELGEKTGLSYKFIGEIERGEVNPSLNSLVKIANTFGVKISALFPSDVDAYHQFSIQDIQLIRKTLKLLNRYFVRL